MNTEQVARSAQAQGTTETRRRIDDFGEHIPGARKDLTASATLAAWLEGDPAGQLPLGETWPAPPWTKLAEEQAAAGRDEAELATVRSLRDELRVQQGRRFERWIAAHGDGLGGLRRLALEILDGKLRPAEALTKLTEASRRTGHRCMRRAKLYELIGHEHDLGRYDFSTSPTGRCLIYGSLRHAGCPGQSLAEAAETLRGKLESDKGTEKKTQGPKAPPFEVRYLSVRGEREYGIWRRARGGLICIQKCPSAKDAQRIVREEADALEAWWERWRNLPAMRRATNAPRTPAGLDATGDPATFSFRYGLRGVQFGNWVEDARRETDLRDASQGLSDLARTLGWPAQSLSLGGRLGLAFGARGKGGPRAARAHYESCQEVIAISKPNGPGTLAHEWFHALDHHVGRYSGGGGEAYATKGRTWQSESPLDGMARALARYGAALKPSTYYQRAKILDKRQSRTKPYWSSTIELAARGFEAWVKARLAKDGISNDYLANFLDRADWPLNVELGHVYPYPYEDELALISNPLDEMAAEGAKLENAWGPG